MTIDYKDTLNLPKTAFKMKANLANREPQMLAEWQQNNLYQKLREQCAKEERPKFILHDGPPYANGPLHLGHALNKTLKDIIIKSKTLSGYDAPYVPGWDCHGLPIELQVEKKGGKANKKEPAEFRKQCRSYAAKQLDNQRQAFIRLGVLGDWDSPYVTMDYSYEANVQRTLAKAVANGHVHRGYKPVHWCCECGSALAEAEVEYQNKDSHAIDVKFRVLDQELFWARCNHSAGHIAPEEIIAPIWTTTPWTLPANQAVALHPNLEYVVVEAELDTGKKHFFLAEQLAQDTLGRYQINDYKVIASCNGKDVEGLLLQHPFYGNRQVPFVLGEHVTTDAGTGLVHTAPGHGLDDYAVGVKYKLPVDHQVDAKGYFSASLDIFAGEHIFKANNSIIELLKSNGSLLHEVLLSHSYPHCWRHKTPLIFRGTPQWFIGMELNGLRAQALSAIDNTKWFPERGKTRIYDLVQKRPDWCISRQRVWGTPLPFFIHKDTHQLHPATVDLIATVAARVQQGGIDEWDLLDKDELLGSDSADYTKCTDTLDVWFDSGSSFACVLQQNPQLEFPADLYLEGSDQHRGWFHTSLLTALAANGSAPYKAVLTHGFTVDAKGRKMSKSLGNVISPDQIYKTLGADILRLWVASTDYRGEVTVSDEILQRSADVYRRLRNTARFLLANICDFDVTKHALAATEMLALDRWIVDKAKLVQQEIIQDYNEYNFHKVYQKIHNFCNLDLGSFYLDVIKDRQYTMATDSIGRRSAQTAMYHILQALVRWVAPILSFTAEEIWQHMPSSHDDSVFLTKWYDGFNDIAVDNDLNHQYWHEIAKIRTAVNKELEKARTEGVIGSALQAEVVLYCCGKVYEDLTAIGDELRFVLITSTATVVKTDSPPEAAQDTEISGLWVKVNASSANKCQRCWHYLADVGSSSEHPELCGRCITNITTSGEKRRYA
jgi:isoleucyl-tRNA synthetase